MSAEYRKFHKAKIIDNNTVRGIVDSRDAEIEVEGGLPANTTHVTVRKEARPDGTIVIGAFIKGRELPMTLQGRFKESGVLIG